ncbi:TPA: DUF5301 domain-containing protein [Streptococcus suis]
MKKFLIYVSSAVLILTFLIVTNIKTNVELPKADKIVIKQNEEMIKTLEANEVVQVYRDLESTKPYISKNPSIQDEPFVNEYYTLILYDDNIEVAYAYLYEYENETFLEKPYDYTVKLRLALEELSFIK